MNIEFFLARRLGSSSKQSFSRTILRIAIAAIALSVAVMIVASSMVTGFKNTISEKIFGFWGHIHITNDYAHTSYAFDASPMNINQPYYYTLDSIRKVYYVEESNFLGQAREVEKSTNGGFKHIQIFANKEGIIKTKDQIEGIILRGVGPDYKWEFLQKYIIEGDTLVTDGEKASSGILISERTAKRLHLKLGDSFQIYFVQGGTSLGRKFKISGIYKTGLEEYDRRFALVDIRKIQKLNNWRPFRNYKTELWLDEERINIMGLTEETGQNWDFASSRMLSGEVFDLSDSSSHAVVIPERVARKRKLIVGDSLLLNFKDLGEDQYTFRFKVSGIYQAPDDPGLKKTIFAQWNRLNEINSKLPPQISGYEVFVDDINDIDELGLYLNSDILRGRAEYGSTIKEMEPNIFDWLNLTDMNERIILILMILVAIINMTTSLMILILERTKMIGVLKALGAKNWTIRKVFLYNAARIVGWGLFWGNIIGIGLCIAQKQLGIIRLPEELYYVAIAPVQMNALTILLLNLGTLLITLLVLIIPSWLVSKVDPVKAIRFK